jgi:prepilin-type N-terminal cleavage/methylation domain-containing protein
MNSKANISLRPAPTQRGFTLVELMVTVAIALFLLGGLVTIVQNVRTANLNQTALAQLADEQRFALTVITDAIQAGGYFADPTTQTNSTVSLAPAANPAPTAAYAAGWVFAGSHTVGAIDSVATDSIATRFQTALGYGPILCDGTDTSKQAAGNYSIQFSIQATAGVGNQLMCSVNGGAAVALVTGVKAMAVYYGVKRDQTIADYNVDTYVTWDKMSTLNGANDYENVSAVRIVLTFDNPLFGQANQPQTITVERVIEVMARAGLHT